MTSGQERSVVVPVPVRSPGLLSSWSAHDWREGVCLDELALLERLVVQTANSTYEIVLVAPDQARILVRGGAFFPVFTPARLAGCSLGGSFLKLHSIHVGFRMELVSNAQSIVTSPVQMISFSRSDAVM